MSDTLSLQLEPIAAEIKSLYEEETETTQLVLRKKPHSLTIQQGTKVTTLLLLFHYCAQLFLHLFLDSLNTGGLPNQPSQSRGQPMRDLTKLGFADYLALLAGLEEVSRTCC